MPRTLQLRGGKRHRQPSIAATGTAGEQTSRLLFVTDRATGRRFLVDTGAEVSILPPSHAGPKRRPSDIKLHAVNGTDIPTFGECSLTMDLGLRRVFRWVFVVAVSSFPILGADFLRHHGLLVDMHGKRLMDTT